ncbi:MAG: thioesterase family protein [Myxococcota bacterium]
MAQAVTIEVPVAWGDMDAFGHVNNVVYLRWFESGRIAFFERVAIEHRDVANTHAPILARTSCNFVLPLTYPDTVQVHTALERIGTKSFTMTYRIHSRTLDQTAAQGDGTIVWYDYAAKSSAAIPDDLRARLLPFCADAT